MSRTISRVLRFTQSCICSRNLAQSFPMILPTFLSVKVGYEYLYYLTCRDRGQINEVTPEKYFQLFLKRCNKDYRVISIMQNLFNL